MSADVCGRPGCGLARRKHPFRACAFFVEPEQAVAPACVVRSCGLPPDAPDHDPPPNGSHPYMPAPPVAAGECVCPFPRTECPACERICTACDNAAPGLHRCASATCALHLAPSPPVADSPDQFTGPCAICGELMADPDKTMHDACSEAESPAPGAGSPKPVRPCDEPECAGLCGGEYTPTKPVDEAEAIAERVWQSLAPSGWGDELWEALKDAAREAFAAGRREAMDQRGREAEQIATRSHAAGFAAGRREGLEQAKAADLMTESLRDPQFREIFMEEFKRDSAYLEGYDEGRREGAARWKAIAKRFARRAFNWRANFRSVGADNAENIRERDRLRSIIATLPVAGEGVER